MSQLGPHNFRRIGLKRMVVAAVVDPEEDLAAQGAEALMSAAAAGFHADIREGSPPWRARREAVGRVHRDLRLDSFRFAARFGVGSAFRAFFRRARRRRRAATARSLLLLCGTTSGPSRGARRRQGT